MSNSAQWFLDVQYWGGLGEVIPFSDYREARQRCQELLKIVQHEMPSFVHEQGEDDHYAGVVPDNFVLVLHTAELSDCDGYRVSGVGSGDADRVDELADARLWEGLPFIVGKYRIKWLDRGDNYTRVAGWPSEVVEFAHG